jgi:hypothetical protein
MNIFQTIDPIIKEINRAKNCTDRFWMERVLMLLLIDANFIEAIKINSLKIRPFNDETIQNMHLRISSIQLDYKQPIRIAHTLTILQKKN